MDKSYWSTFYSNASLPECSNFCEFVIQHFCEHANIKHVLDAGCGNGRDSLVLSQHYKVTAVDNCGIQIETDKYIFLNKDFVTIDKSNYDLIYSRFTFHSITNDNHSIFLSTILPNTYLAIETRSTKGSEEIEFYGKTHFRNYTNINYLTTLLEKHCFEILFLQEDKDFAVYKTENPVCIRVLCKKL